MREYSKDISEQKIVYESEEYVVCHPWAMPGYIHVYHLCNYKPSLAKKSKDGWLCCGTWYRKNDGRYHDSNNFYGCGLGVADNVEQIVEIIKNKRSEKDA